MPERHRSQQPQRMRARAAHDGRGLVRVTGLIGAVAALIGAVSALVVAVTPLLRLLR